MTESIYGEYGDRLFDVLNDIKTRFKEIDDRYFEDRGEHKIEHISARIKSEESMRDKCIRKGLPPTTESALGILSDAVGVRVVFSYVDSIYEMIEEIRKFPDCRIIREKDYIRHAKPNGYRSYHLILELTEPFPDCMGNERGKYLVEVQLRTIAMDSWASLEHQLKYKKDIKNEELIVSELKRCADELAACDVSMQTIKDLIDGNL
jgi:ppGpp synthetase/RelA/SpoT-type nucleotidyltranferase